MATKENPGRFDCYSNALPDEPMFILLARDPDFQRIVRDWAHKRQLAINCGARPESDLAAVQEALLCADAGADWRAKNIGKWRRAGKNK